MAGTDALFRPEVMIAQRHKPLQGELAVPSTPVRWLLMLTAVVLLVSLYCIARYGSYARAERASGFLRPGAGEVRVVANMAGAVQQLQVKLGDQVSTGQTLAILTADQHPEYDPNLALELASAIRRLDENLPLLEQNQTREASYLASEIALLESQFQALGRERQTQSKLSQLAARQAHRGETLMTTGNISVYQFEQLSQVALEHEQGLEQLGRAQDVARSNLEQARFQLAGLADRYRAERLVLERERTRHRKNQLDYLKAKSQTLVARAGGEVTVVNVHVGSTVRPGRMLLVITPANSHLEAVLFLPPKSGGFIEQNQRVQLYVSAFPHEQFGAVPGHITGYTRSVLLPSELPYPTATPGPTYQVVVALMDQKLGGFRLRSGMDVTANITLESRAVWEWMVAPVLRWRNRLTL